MYDGQSLSGKKIALLKWKSTGGGSHAKKDLENRVF